MADIAGGEHVRLFALCDEDDDEQKEIALYGVALPGGATATITPKGRPHGCWSSPDRAAHMLGPDLVWLDPGRVNR
jgi:hypothetical protein